MRTTDIYRGYRLFVQQFGLGWRVFIYAPGNNIALSESPNTQDSNGQDAIIREARAIVDTELSLGPRT
jgi:hypothetical protein